MEWKESLAQITKDNGAIQSLKNLLIETAFKDEALTSTFTTKFNVENGEHLGWRGSMTDVGWAGSGCNPEYRTPSVSLAEKVWELGDWELPLQWCYTEFEDTLAEYALKEGTDRANLQNTDIWRILISDPLADALVLMQWRKTWLGDKDAKNVAEGGKLTAGVDPKLFKTCDGLFKRLFALPASQHTTIAANAETTAALQKSKLKTAGIAIGIFEDILENADARIFGQSGAKIMCTKSLADALTKDLKVKYQDRLTWEENVKGIKVTELDGVKIEAISIWDRLIQKYESTVSGSTGKFNLPHRAVFCDPENLLVGTPANNSGYRKYRCK